jgi:hypothetical protein
MPMTSRIDEVRSGRSRIRWQFLAGLAAIGGRSLPPPAAMPAGDHSDSANSRPLGGLTSLYKESTWLL